MIPFSVLDLSPIIEGKSAADAFRNTLDLARHAERCGYHRYWMAEHHNMPGIASAATAVVIAHVAGGTERIRVGSGGVMLPNHAPLVIAEQFGTLESLFPGRIDLGLGRAPGTDQRTARALRRSMTGSDDSFPQDVAELQAWFAPVQPGQSVRAVPGAGLNVPIWLLGSSLFSAQLAAQMGLPFAFASHFAPDYLMRALDIYRSTFQPSAALAKPYAMAGLNVFAAETDAAAVHLIAAAVHQSAPRHARSAAAAARQHGWLLVTGGAADGRSFAGLCRGRCPRHGDAWVGRVPGGDQGRRNHGDRTDIRSPGASALVRDRGGGQGSPGAGWPSRQCQLAGAARCHYPEAIPPKERSHSVTDYVRRILDARVYDVAIQSALDPMPRLSARLKGQILLKREDLQPIFSFKIRGAYNRITRLSQAARDQGVICASAGNHAQGVALSAQKLGIAATIVMPVTTPQIKIDAVRHWGGKVVLHGDAFDEAYAHAKLLEAERGLTFIHPFDDPDVIAGQGTIGVEILQQHADPIEAIFVPIGGGGLASGVASYVKFLRPEIKVIGVEPVDAASMKAAIDAKERVVLDRVGLFADGVAVRQAGVETFRLCSQLLDDVLLADTDEMCAAVKDIFEDMRVIAEPAGALALAGLKSYATAHPKRSGALIAINSGANMNFDRLRHVAERAEIGEAREILLGVTIPEQQGSYRRFVQVLGNRNITEFNYRYAQGSEAHVFVGLKLRGEGREKAELLAQLKALDYDVLDISANEAAKIHVRYMVGGRVPNLADEIVLRFEFPERPGALLKFLDGVGAQWNITLFHYRNHGADYGRVLAGLQVPQQDRARFSEQLAALGYPYEDETANPAYRMFLGNQASSSGTLG